MGTSPAIGITLTSNLIVVLVLVLVLVLLASLLLLVQSEQLFAILMGHGDRPSTSRDEDRAATVEVN